MLIHRSWSLGAGGRGGGGRGRGGARGRAGRGAGGGARAWGRDEGWGRGEGRWDQATPHRLPVSLPSGPRLRGPLTPLLRPE